MRRLLELRVPPVVLTLVAASLMWLLARTTPGFVWPGGLRAIKVRYEYLVAEPEAVLRRVLAFLGLPFDPCVLAPEENRRTVLTLSFEQVRRPINTSAIGRWKKYASAFDASWDALDSPRAV